MQHLHHLLNLYRTTLLDDVIPFWERHAIDSNGGINTCIGDDGAIISRDRWNWSQWRAVWVWSKLYNSVERRPQWLDRAKGIHRFISSHGPLENGHWPPHLHFQLIRELGDWSGDYPGVCKYSEKEKYLANSPDPDLMLGMMKYAKR